MIRMATDPDDAIPAATFLRQISETGLRLGSASRVWLTRFKIGTTLQALDYRPWQKQLWNKPLGGGSQ